MAKTTSKRTSPAPKRAISTITLPALKKGERYCGILLDANGKPTAHVIALPGVLERATWQEAMDWAKKQGGELPDRQAGALAYANAKDFFGPHWHWLSEQRAGYPGYAWYQSFGYGYQDDNHKDSDYRVRAVRRVSI